MRSFPRLVDRLIHQVEARDRADAEILFNYRRIRFVAADVDRLVAEVRGGASGRRPREVRLSWPRAERESVVEASCDCAAAASGRVCCHVWATLLLYEQREGRLPGGKKLTIELAPPGKELPWPEAGRLPTYRSGLHDHVYKKIAGDLGEGVAPLENWREDVARLRSRLAPRERLQEVIYQFNHEDSRRYRRLTVNVCQQAVRKDGRLGNLKAFKLSEDEAARLPEPADRELLGLMLAAASGQDVKTRYDPGRSKQRGYSFGIVPAAAYGVVLPRLTATRRFWWDRYEDYQLRETLLQWDERPWRFVLAAERRDDLAQARVHGLLRRGEENAAEGAEGNVEQREMVDADLVLTNGLLLLDGVLSPLDVGAGGPWIDRLLQSPNEDLLMPSSELPEFVDVLRGLPALPRLALPPDLQFERKKVVPVPGVRVELPRKGRRDRLLLDVFFQYGGTRVDAWTPVRGMVDAAGNQIERDPRSEQSALGMLVEWEGIQPRGKTVGRLKLKGYNFHEVVNGLLRRGWIVEADGRRVRPHRSIAWSIRSQVDWFELRAVVDFEGVLLETPELLKAVEAASYLVRLGDGTEGMLPEVWLKRYAPVAQLTQAKDGKVPMTPPQAALIAEVLAAAGEEVEADPIFDELRRRMRDGERPLPMDAPRGFRGELRAYQREGLGWLLFLAEMGMGGCLADDMGLGKTVQILALLATYHEAPPHGAPDRPEDAARESPRKPPSLVIVPRSLIHNWLDEARRFTPTLRVLNYAELTQEERHSSRSPDVLAGWDVVVLTYGLLRRDSYALDDQPFSYVVLDEAQAIKNPSSRASWATRSLDARYRLAVTGTPVENHLGELWSLFEFLNPGILGSIRAFYSLGHERGGLEKIARALRPFMLRRNKEEVLEDLPPKTEQTLYIDLEDEERTLYTDLRDHYRAQLLSSIDSDGLGRSKLQVLEALLRLRQASCHAGLIDESKAKTPSPKLRVLLENLDEVLAEGHKALVFSQFVRLLDLLRAELDKRKIPYEYLDGQTRDRTERVEHFQTDEKCKLFLISLKAGGVGLNLTAADYVFILDPWWNPAVEAQAVDRAHRIGQERPVFAYRLVTRETVEEKILKLQESKRQLADAILSESTAGIRDMTADDVVALFSD